MQALLLFIVFIICVTNAFSALHIGLSLSGRSSRNKRIIVGQAIDNMSAQHAGDQPLAASVVTKQTSNRKDTIAKLLGYAIGVGAMSLYAPIIVSLVTTKDSSGFSISTWALNVLGSILAISYPIKKKFSLSTYIEMIVGLVQGVAILGLVCMYQGLSRQYLQGMLPTLGLFSAFIVYDKVPEEFLKALQVVAIIVCTYSNVPQIVLTFRRGHASWSGITALLSTVGCIIRIFTTLQLTQDRLILMGYSLGLLTNAVLLGQVIWYNHLSVRY